MCPLLCSANEDITNFQLLRRNIIYILECKTNGLDKKVKCEKKKCDPYDLCKIPLSMYLSAVYIVIVNYPSTCNLNTMFLLLLVHICVITVYFYIFRLFCFCSKV